MESPNTEQSVLSGGCDRERSGVPRVARDQRPSRDPFHVVGCAVLSGKGGGNEEGGRTQQGEASRQAPQT
eukprot:7831757-Pyramimonas_sp.AAC.1